MVTHTGTDPDEPVVKVVLLEVLQPEAAPTAFFGTTYQLYREEGVSPVAL